MESKLVNPFESIDDETVDVNNDLLAHLIKDISEVDLEMEDLDMKICDLKASSHKSNKNKKPKKSRKRFNMRGIFWNSRGLSDLAKYRYIADTIKENNLDFIAIMETGKQDMSRLNLTRLSGGVDFVWHCLPPRGRSGYFFRY